MKYIKIEPEVIVGLGEDTNIDTSTVPPVVNKLHINLEDLDALEFSSQFSIL